MITCRKFLVFLSGIIVFFYYFPEKAFDKPLEKPAYIRLKEDCVYETESGTRIRMSKILKEVTFTFVYPNGKELAVGEDLLKAMMLREAQNEN